MPLLMLLLGIPRIAHRLKMHTITMYLQGQSLCMSRQNTFCLETIMYHPHQGRTSLSLGLLEM